MLRLKPYAPYRDFRRGCCGCMTILILALILAVLLSCVLGLGLGRWFTPTAHAGAEGERQVLLLAPAIPTAPYRTMAYGAFYSNRVVVNVGPGSIGLASTPDGKGALLTDDQVILIVTHPDGTKSEWAHDFRSGNHPVISSIPAQDVSSLFVPGINTVSIVLVDLMPNTYSSSPYYLIYTPPLAVVTVTRADITAVPSTTPTLEKRVNPTITLANPTVAGNVIVATATRTVSPTIDLPLPNEPASGAGATSEFDSSTPYILGGGVLLLGIGLYVVAGRQRRRTRAGRSAVSFGWLDLYDRQTRESRPSLDLTRWTKGFAIQLDPLRLKPLGEAGPTSIEIRPSAEGMLLIAKAMPVVQVAGSKSETPTAQFSETANHLLHDGMQLLIGGRLELGYRNPRESHRVAAPWWALEN